VGARAIEKNAVWGATSGDPSSSCTEYARVKFVVDVLLG
jgi:hypothetical protein